MRVSRVSRLSASCVILGSLQCAWLPSAQAQATGEEPSTQLVLEDVVVTARRVGESRLAVPAAVTSISTVELERYAAVDLESIAALAPQVTVTRVPSSNGASFVIRGIGSSPFDAGLEQSVAVNIDGVQTSRGRIVNLGMFDVQQVEVLKGPQALFFGKNSPAGVISIVSADPTSVFEGHIRVGYEFEADERYAEGMISGPLSETVRARLAVRASDMNGWLRNVVAPSPNPLAPDLPAPGSQRGRQPGNEEVLGRLTLEWSPTDSLQAKLKIAVGNGRANGESGVIEVMCTDGKTVPMEFGVPDTQNDCRLDGVKHVADLSPVVAATMPYVNGGVPFSRDRTTLSTLTINYDRGDLSLTSVTGYARLNAKYADNYNYSSFGSVFAGETELSRTWSQELRLVSSFDHPLNFTAGLYYESGRRHAASASYLGVLGGLPDLATGNYYTFGREASNRGETYSAFGQLRWTPVDNLEVAGGVRWTRDEKRVDIGNVYAHYLFAANLTPVGEVIHGDYEDEDWSPEVTLTWRLTPEQTLYTAYRTGYKSGGFANPALLDVTYNAEALLFENESAEGGEIGYKALLFDGRASIDATAYYYTFDDLQVASWEPAALSFHVRNAAKARSKGVEVAGLWRATDQLTTRGAVAYNRAHYVSFPGAQCYAGQTQAQGCIGGFQDLAGKPLVRAPEWTVNLGADYEVPLGRYTLTFSADANYSDAYFTNEDLNPKTRQESFWLTNASIRLQGPNDVWEVMLIGRNLTDETYWRFSSSRPFGDPDEFAVAIARPREIAIQGLYRF